MLHKLIPAAKAAFSFFSQNPALTSSAMQLGKTVWHAATRGPRDPNAPRTDRPIPNPFVQTPAPGYVTCPICDGVGQIPEHNPEPGDVN